jgi:hypothetical protein
MVRQLFKTGVLQSAFWHLFTMTAHSPVGLEPDKYMVRKKTDAVGSFANNDIEHIDMTGADHETFSFGLKKSLYNYMHQIGLDDPLQKWFDFPVPKTTVPPDYIINAIKETDSILFRPTAKVIWTGNLGKSEFFTQTKKGNSREMISVSFATKKQTVQVQFPKAQGSWLINMLPNLSIDNPKIWTLQELKDSYEAAGLEDFELFWDNKPVSTMNKLGLLKL